MTITGLYVFLWGKKSEIDQSVSKTLTTSGEKIENEDHMITNDKNTKLPV